MKWESTSRVLHIIVDLKVSGAEIQRKYIEFRDFRQLPREDPGVIMRSSLKPWFVCFVLLGFLVNVGSMVAATQPKVATRPKIAFWYEDWQENILAKLRPANLIIGVQPSAVGQIHGAGSRALNYVTFYQAVFGTDFLKDAADLSNVGFHTKDGYLPSAFGKKDNYVLCSNSIELRRRISAYVRRTIGDQKYDGLFVDNLYLAPASVMVCDASHPHVKPAANGAEAYIDLLREVYQGVKKINRNAIIITNSGSPRYANELRSGTKTVRDFSDYMVWESYGYSSHLGAAHDRWTSTIAQSFAPDTTLHTGKIIALSYPRNLAEAIYSYAISQIFGFGYAANLGEQDYMKDREGGHFGIFLSQLPADLGRSKSSPPQDRQNAVLTRDFSHAKVVANTGSTSYSLKTQRSVILYDGNGSKQVPAGTQIVIPPSNAVVFVFR
jgi:hypothetical protein